MAKLDALFKHLRDQEASDLFLVVGEPPKMRIHGTIVNVEGAPKLSTDMMNTLLYEILSEDQKKAFDRDRDLDFAHAVPGVARFRSNYFHQNDGPAAVFRLIPEKIIPLVELKLPAVIGTFADYARGLILVTGPTGSGKSTTLAGIINEMNERYPKHVITIEDPLEFVHIPKRCMITHREVGRHCETFDSALMASVREDPDVILVGEMRDLETVRLALTAAEMGFLVLGTLHTNSASKTVDRIVDIFPAAQQPAVRTMLAGSLVAISSQLLIRGADHKSRHCATEILISGPGLGNAIREGNINMIKSNIQAGGAQGMMLMDTSIEKLVQAGRVDPEDAYLKASDKQRFLQYLPKKAGVH
jgi:twitching motility protein PilT